MRTNISDIPGYREGSEAPLAGTPSGTSYDVPRIKLIDSLVHHAIHLVLRDFHDQKKDSF
jgi:hypothetical protein